MFDLQ
jgi:hypothetical protein